MLTYQIREFIKGADKTFEVWQCHCERRLWWGPTLWRWESIDEFDSFEAAEHFISEKAGGYYKSTHDYDENGKSIVYCP